MLSQMPFKTVVGNLGKRRKKVYGRTNLRLHIPLQWVLVCHTLISFLGLNSTSFSFCNPTSSLMSHTYNPSLPSLNYKASRSPAKSEWLFIWYPAPLPWGAFGDVSICVSVERNLNLFNKHSRKILSCSRDVTFHSSGEQRGLHSCLKGSSWGSLVV